jgi:D-beta-D-heptose 7-phosphate kinase/D-beta-D-heptose 1-phosphate adenosyltransferase
MLNSAADKKQLRRVALGFPGKRILVVGDLMLDQYVRGTAGRISPEAPVPVVRVTGESMIPGGAGNVAANLAALQARVSVMGVIGDDEAGRRLLADFGEMAVDTGHVIFDRHRVTSQKCRIVAERQQVVRYDRETDSPLSVETEGRILERLEPAVRDSEAVILSDYGKGVVTPRILAATIRLAKRGGVPVTVDPKIEHFRRYRGVTCITPNLHEAWSGMRRSPRPGLDELERLGKDILRTLRCESVLITRGPDGMSLFKANGRIVHVPTQAREVFDVTGAGDTVISTLTLALASGAKIEQAAVVSNHAAGIVVGKLGTATTSIPEILRALR